MTDQEIKITLKDKNESLKEKKANLSINELLKWRRMSEQEINKLTDQLDELRKTIISINKTVWKKCDHKWCTVEGATTGDLCNKYCEICNLYSIASLYR